MTRWKRWTSGFMASIDSVITQVENHEAQVASALRELERGAARSKVQLLRVERDGAALRNSLNGEREAAERWRERAKREGEEKRALECLRRSKRSHARSSELERQLEEHERIERQLQRDVRTLEQRLVEVQKQRNLLRTRETRAEALTIVQSHTDPCNGEIGAIFERWELCVAESEVHGGGSRVSVDSFEDEFTSAEEDAALLRELHELKVSGAEPEREEGAR